LKGGGFQVIMTLIMRLATVILLLILLSAQPPSAEACSCVSHEPICNSDFSKLEPDNTLVFVGQVRDVDPASMADMQQLMAAQFFSSPTRNPAAGPPDRAAIEKLQMAALKLQLKMFLDIWGNDITAAARERLENTTSMADIALAGMAARRVEISVEEQFVGEAPEVIAVGTGYGGGDCGVDFKAGERYLVITSKGETGIYQTGICSQTGHVRYHGHTLAALRAWKKGEKFPRTVFGQLVDSTTREDRHQPHRPLANVRLTLKGPSHSIEATTNAEGAFELTDVPADKYDVLVDLPGWTHSTVSDGVKPLDMTANRCASLSVWMEQEQGTIRGLLKPAPGESLPDYIWVEAVPADSHSKAPFDATARAETGRFEIDDIEPGSFYVAINVDNHPNGPSHSTATNARVWPYPPTYFPGVSEPAKAAVFRVERGQTVEIGEWVLPPKLKEARLSARVVMPDGSPAADARLVLRRTGREKERISHFGPTGADGNIELIVLSGLPMEVEAIAAKDERFYRAVVAVESASPAKPIIIELQESGKQESDRQFFDAYLWNPKPRSR
jgi:hypothetical protein